MPKTGSSNRPPRLTPTHHKILEALADGEPHDVDSLRKCLWDDMSKNSTLQYHVSILRKILRARGEEILCERVDNHIHYRHVRISHLNHSTPVAVG